MHMILYTSDHTGKDENIKAILKSIEQSAKKNNPAHNVTGLLFYHNSKFLQVIEGEKDELEKLMAVIEKDDRHDNIVRIMDEPITTLAFEKWNMDSLDLSNTDAIDNDELKLIRDVYKHNFTVKTDVIVDFFKAMMKSHDIK